MFIENVLKTVAVNPKNEQKKPQHALLACVIKVWVSLIRRNDFIIVDCNLSVQEPMQKSYLDSRLCGSAYCWSQNQPSC